MIVTTDHKLYQKVVKVGKGSILKALRLGKGAGRGLIAGSIVLLVCSVPCSTLCIVLEPDMVHILIGILVSLPGLLMLVLGIWLKHKRDSSWMSYYQQETGFSEGELAQVDRELAGPSVSLVICKTPSAATYNSIACYVTEHYVVLDGGLDPYVRRLEDMIAAAFSDSTDIWYLLCLSKQDKAAVTIPLFTDTAKKAALCQEIIWEIYRKNPNLLHSQEIVCEDRHYILERDSEEILRLYQEGHKLETVKKMSSQ